MWLILCGTSRKAETTVFKRKPETPVFKKSEKIKQLRGAFGLQFREVLVCKVMN